MKESPKEKYLILANEMKLTSSIIGLTKYEERAFTLVCFCTYGVNKKIGNVLYHKEKAHLKQVDFTKIGIPQSQVRKTLESLVSKGLTVWEEKNDALRVNEEHLTSLGIDLTETWKVIGKNIKEFNEECLGLYNKKLQVNRSAKAHNIPSGSQDTIPRDKEDRLKTTVADKNLVKAESLLLKYLSTQESVKSPEAFLGAIKAKYGENSLKKLVSQNVEFHQWYEYLDYWKNEGKL